MDDTTRQAYLRRIRFLRDRCGLRWLVDEASGYVTCLDDLADSELITVQATLDRAYQCMREGIPFEDAGIVPASWDGGDDADPDFPNHVSVRPIGCPELSNHVSEGYEPVRAPIPWHQRPENTF